MIFRPIEWLAISILIVTPLISACSSSNKSTAGKFDPVVLSMATTLSVAIGDIDGDGDPDQVIGNDGEPGQIYLNDGSGNFSDSGRTFGSAESKIRSVALVDVDADNDLDLMTGTYGSANVLYKNDGAGHFSATVQAAFTSSNTYAVAFADLDGDNDPDLVVGNYLDTDPTTADLANQVFINDGNGLFTDSLLAFTQLKTLAIALGHLNNDNKIDFVVGYEGSPTEVYLNTSTGGGISFAAPIQLALHSSLTAIVPAPPTYTPTIALGDVDGDTLVDIAVGPSYIYINQGNGSFTDDGQIVSGSLTSSVSLVDVDGDDDLDLVAGILGPPDHIFINNGTGQFTDSGQLLGGSLSSITQGVAPGGTATSVLVAGDLNKDGFIDLVAGNYEQVNRVFLNDKTGKFNETPQLLDSSNTHALACTDLDANGTRDLVAGNGGQSNRVYLGDGYGTFTDTLQLIGNDDTRSVAVGDLDGDQFPDIVAGNFAEANQVYVNDGRGHYTEPAAQSIGIAATRAVALADIDNDGDLDLIVGNHGEPDQVFRNDGQNSGVINFVDTAQALGGTGNTSSVVLGDLNNDTYPDLVVAVDGGPNLVYFYDGLATSSTHGDFIDSGQLLDNVSNSNTSSVALGDIDNDGDLDIVFGNELEQPDAVYLNADGLGTFTNTLQTFGQSSTSSLVLGDIDGDGDMDLVTGSYALPDAVYKNDGKGLFSFDFQSLGHANTNAVVLCDVDGDSDLDLMEGNFGQLNWLYKNLTVR